MCHGWVGMVRGKLQLTKKMRTWIEMRTMNSKKDILDASIQWILQTLLLLVSLVIKFS